ncbi:site-specific DNA-methyltransferase [Sutterella sp.]|uniref:DNA-methyltransferase n=1 Tax=Sutterella sp. TaxID=1981025 RepID=UPI0026E0CD9F|nr:site-specific DNA-methyltransferase [Sutterella sp.]MDO5531632.1 site-specific DNA-methyltransferase [Sutterella sp.]
MKAKDLENVIDCGDALHLVDEMPERSVQMIVTSPPYYGLRRYSEGAAGEAGEIGREESVTAYLDRLALLFTKLLPKVADDGALWLNMGDVYIGKALQGLPRRLALRLIDAGWILRNDVIWQKPNAMPSSVKDRLTVDHEYLFFFTKSSSYYYDADAIREPHVTFSPESRMKGGRRHFVENRTPEAGKNAGNSNLHTGDWTHAFNPKGRNKRTVWSVPLSKFREAHFAVFPERLIEPCILATSRAGDIVMAPFMGSGTTAVVALKHGRKFYGIELNPEYRRMAERRAAACMETMEAVPSLFEGS